MPVIVSRLGCVLTVLAACGGDGTSPKRARVELDASTDPVDGTEHDASLPAAHDAGRDPADADVAHPDAATQANADASTHEPDMHDAAMPAACAEDRDCDDGDTCNGSEHCVDHACAAGSAPCANPDPAHCSVSCQAGQDAATCSVSARDVDQDGFGDPACAAALPAGDDCDDGNASVHPGASEACDGLDNDCNGLADVDDGLTPGGETLAVDTGKNSAVAAWGGESFGVTYVRDNSVWLRELDLHGQPLHDAVLVDGSVGSGNVSGRPSLAFGGSSYGLSWARDKQLAFRRMGKDGQALGEPVDVGPSGFVLYGRTRVASVGNDWVLAFECCQSRPFVHARRIVEGDTVTPPLYAVSNIGSSVLSGLALSGPQLGMLWWRYYDPDHSYYVEWTRRDLDLTPRPDEQPLLTHAVSPGSANQAVMTASDDGWAMAWHESRASDATEHLQFMRVDLNGRVQCASDLDAAYAPRATHLVAEDMVSTEHGFALTARGGNINTGFTLELLQVGADCAFQRRVPLASPSVYPSSVLAHAAGGELLLSWTEGAPSSVKVRALPATVCD